MKIFIVDDHPLFRDGLRQAFAQRPEFQLVGEASTAATALPLILEALPDVVLADVHLPDSTGIELVGKLLTARPSLRILMLSGDSDPALIESALDAGACGYVLKDTIVPVLIHAVEMVMAGKLFISPEASAEMLEYLRKTPVKSEKVEADVSERERDVLRLIADGQRNKEIAAHLGLSTKSIETYRSRLMRKLGCSSPAELVRYAIRTGIVAP